jgi:hypothetical protein
MDLFQYLRRRKGGKVEKNGVMLAQKVKGKGVLVAWSKCKVTGPFADKFDVTRGVDIAKGRIQAYVDEKRNSDVPPSIKERVQEFVTRAKKYFKTKKVKVV